MARKSNKTAHVLNLIAGHDSHKEVTEISTEEAATAELAESAPAAVASSHDSTPAAAPSASGPQNISLIDTTTKDPVAELIQEKLADELQQQTSGTAPEVSVSDSGSQTSSEPQPVIQTETTAAPHPASEPEPAVISQPTPQAEPAVASQSAPQAEPAVASQSTPQTEPAAISQPAPQAEPAVTSQPTPQAEPAVASQPTPQAEPAVASQPTPQAEPAVASQPTPQAEPAVASQSAPQAEPTVASQPTPQAESMVVSQPAAEPEPEPDFVRVNVMEEIVKDKIIYFMRQFDVCTCDRCVSDTIALTLSGMLPKYIVTTPAAVDPLLSYYTNKYISDVTVEATKACMTVKDNPRH